MNELSARQVQLAKIVASVLTEHGLHVSTPDDGDLDDVERERWDACLEIARLSGSDALTETDACVGPR
jgi:hypothetical protein